MANQKISALSPLTSASATDIILVSKDDGGGSFTSKKMAIGNAGLPTAPVVLNYAATVAPVATDGLLRKMTLTGDLHLDPPTSPTEGMRWECWFTCDGSNHSITFDTAILIPSDSGFTSPKTLTASKSYVVILKYGGSAWWLVSVVGGF